MLFRSAAEKEGDERIVNVQIWVSKMAKEMHKTGTTFESVSSKNIFVLGDFRDTRALLVVHVYVEALVDQESGDCAPYD